MSGRRGSGRERKARVSQKRKAETDPVLEVAVKTEVEDERDGIANSGNGIGKSAVKSELETRWEWLSDVWMVYAAELNDQMNQAFSAGKQSLTLSPAVGVSLQVDFRKMIQKNKKTGYQRQIRLAVKENDQYFVWQWQSDEGYWVSYDAKSCILLESARQDEKVVSLSLGGKPYTIDLVAMVQKNNQTQHEREIQRCLSDAADEESEQPKQNVSNGPTPAKRSRKNKSIETTEEDSKEQVRTLVLKGKAPVDPECHSKVGKAHVFCEGDDVYDVMLNQEGITRHYEHHRLGEEYQYQLQEHFHQPSLQYHSWHSMPDYNAQRNPQGQASHVPPSEAFQNEIVDLRKSPDCPHEVPTHSFLETEVQTPCSYRKSTVWDFFHLKDPSIGIRNATSAFCNLCTREVKRGSTPGRLGTTAMRNHLAKHHQREWSATGSTGIITAPINSRHHYSLASTSQNLPQEPGLPLLHSVLDICYCFFATVCTLCGAVISRGETVGANREYLMLQHMQSHHSSILKVSLSEMQGAVDVNNSSSL